jgi:O-antigen ligase
VRIVIAVLLGGIVGAVGVLGGIYGLAVAAVVTFPFLIAALATIGASGLKLAIVLVAAGIGYCITIYHSPQVTAFEPVAVVTACVVMWLSRHEFIKAVRKERLVLLFVLALAAILALGMLYVLWQPVHLGRATAAKELGRNIEVFVLALGVFAYADSGLRFARMYAVLVAVVLAAVLQPVVASRGHVLSTDSLQTDAPLLFVILALPWASRIPVAFLLSIASVVLVVARTRGGWIGAIVIALFVLSQRRLRLSIGRNRIALIGAAIVFLIGAVFAIPSARARAESLVSGHDQSIKTRLEMMRAATIEVQHHPLTGVGPGEFKRWMLVHGAPVNFEIGLTFIPKDPHDVFAKFAAEMGFPGLALIVLWVIGVLASPWVAWRRYGPVTGELRPYFVGVALYAPIYLFSLAGSEWGSITRVQLALAAGVFLSLLRLAPRHLAATPVAPEAS